MCSSCGAGGYAPTIGLPGVHSGGALTVLEETSANFITEEIGTSLADSMLSMRSLLSFKNVSIFLLVFKIFFTNVFIGSVSLLSQSCCELVALMLSYTGLSVVMLMNFELSLSPIEFIVSFSFSICKLSISPIKLSYFNDGNEIALKR